MRNVISTIIITLASFTALTAQVNGGSVTTADGSTTAFVCPMNDVPDFVAFTNTGSGAFSYSYIITNLANIVLAIESGASMNFDGFGIGQCKVYGVSYTGNLTVTPGQDLSQLSSYSDGLSDLSDDFILINRDQPDGASVSLADGGLTATVTLGGNQDLINMANTSAAVSQYVYLIADSLLRIVGVSYTPDFLLGDFNCKECNVYGASYTGQLLWDQGAIVFTTSSDDCFDLSVNAVQLLALAPSDDCDVDVTFSDPTCPQVVLPANCECEGQMTEITVQYQGANQAPLSVEDKDGHAVASYIGVFPDQLLTVRAADAGLDDLSPKTYWSVGEGSPVMIHTSCSEDIIGGTFGDFLVVGYVDGDGNICGSEIPAYACNGSIQAVANGGTAPYTYTWTPDDPDLGILTGASIDNLCEGAYELEVTDALGCTSETTVVLASPELCTPTFLPAPEPCECEGGVQLLVMTYNGPADATVTFYNKDKIYPSALIEEFEHVNAGDMLVIAAHSIDEDKFASTIAMAVNGQLDNTIHTSCSKPLQGVDFGSITVVGFIDKYDNVCNVPADLIPPVPCACDGGTTLLLFTYEGEPEATVTFYNKDKIYPSAIIEAFTNVQPGDQLVITAQSIGEDKFASTIAIAVNGQLNGTLHTSCSQPLEGAQLPALSLQGFIDKEGNVCNVPAELVPELPCECKGGVQLLVLEYNGPENANVSFYNKNELKPDYLIRSFEPVIPGSSLVISADMIGDDKLGKEIAVGVNGDLDAVIHTSCSKPLQDVTFGSVTVTGYIDKYNNVCNVSGELIPPPPCDCEGGTQTLGIRYNGPSGVLVNFYNAKEPKSDDLVNSFPNVQDGDVLFVHASMIGEEKFSSSVFLETIGGGMDAKLHVSCSQPLEGASEGSFTVIGYIDREGNNCNVPGVIGKLPAHRYVVEAPAKTEVTAYPNPTEGRLKVSLFSPEDRLTVRIFDALGHTTFELDVHMDMLTQVLYLDLGDRPAGLYFLTVTAGTETQVQRIMLH